MGGLAWAPDNEYACQRGSVEDGFETAPVIEVDDFWCGIGQAH